MRFADSIFASLLKPIDRRQFARIVDRHEGDAYDKSFRSWDHLVALVYAQLGKVESVRALEAGFNANSQHHYHLGTGRLARSTLADANARRPAEVFADAFAPRHDTRYNDYTPQTLPVPARYAAYSANLAVLAVLAAGEVTGRSLFPMARDPVGEWRKLALLWRSQLPREGWAGLIGAIALDRIWENDQREIVLRRDERTGQPSGRTDPHWSYNRGPSHEYRQVGRPFGWMLVNDVWLRNQAWFLCDDSDDALAHALEPFAGDFNAVISGFHSYWPDQGRAVSAANALITLWLASSSDCALGDLIGAYDTCLEIAIRAKFSPNESRTRERFRILVLRKIASDQRLPEEWLDSAIIRIQDAATKTSAELFEAAALLRIANEIFPERMASRFQDSGWQPGRPATPEN